MPKEPPLPPELRARVDALGGASAPDDWRAAGNECFAGGFYLSAIRCYTRALEAGADTAVLRSNRSAAYLKSSMLAGPSLALKDAERAAALEPSWAKAHLRVGDAQFARRHYDEAKSAYERALAIDGACQSAAASLRLAEAELFLRALDAEEKRRAREDPPRPPESSANSTLSANGNSTETTTGRESECEAVGRRIDEWSREALPVESRTATRPFAARLDEADRRAGVAYRSGLLAQYRGRLDGDGELRRGVELRRDAAMRRGEGVDYRNAEPHRAALAGGTDGVGRAISTDAYKSHRYESKMW